MIDGLTQISMRLKRSYMSLAEEIHHLLLDAFIDGDIRPGTRINDIDLANRLGVSRTPVREALRGLQAIGIVETLPARVTRVSTLTSEEFEHAKTVWVSLFEILLKEVAHRVDEDRLDEMRTIAEALAEPQKHRFSSASFRLFEVLISLSSNVLLKKSIHAAACRMRLSEHAADPHESLNPTVAQAHHFLTALAGRDHETASRVFDRIVGSRHVESYELAAS